MSDSLLRGITKDMQFRIFAVNATQTVQQARDLHDLSPISTLLLGKMLCGAAMLSMDLKRPEAEITIRINGQGELQGGVAICTASGFLRGYAYQPKLLLSEARDNFFTGKALGNGTMTIMRTEPDKTPHSGTIDLVSGEIAEDLAYYFSQSEQIPSAVNLGVLIDPNARIRSAGGFIIQQLPNAKPELADKLNDNIAQTPHISDLMDMGLSIEEIMNRFVLKDIPWQINEQRAIAYKCKCSKDRFAAALVTLGAQELESMTDGIKPVCHYCNTEYIFTHQDMIDIINKAKL